MNGKDYFKAVFEYHYALFDRVWESIATLSEAQFTRESDYSRGSLHGQMLHMASAEIRWLGGLVGDPEASRFSPAPEDYPTSPSVRALWNENKAKMMAFIETLDEEILQQVFPKMRGPLWQILAHLANHGTDHRAQVLQLLHEYGAPTFNQDMIFHFWNFD